MEEKSKNNDDLNLLKDFEGNVEFTIPDLQLLKIERNGRNQKFFSKLDHPYSENLNISSSERSLAATKIQKVFRGYIGRKYYLDVLFEKVLESESDLNEQQNRQVKEGELLIENYKIERELEETDAVTRNKSRLFHSNATIIQRAWRARHNIKHEHQCCPCNDNFPDLYEYYSETQTICFCCDEHRQLTDQERFVLLFENDIAKPLSEEILSQSTIDWSAISSALNGEMTTTSIDNVDIQEKSMDLTQSTSVPNFNITESITTNNTVNVIDTVSNPNNLVQTNEKTVLINEKNVSSKEISRLSLAELKIRAQQLQNAVSEKNFELLKELMARDDLFSKHENLLIDAEYLSKKEQEIRR